MILYEFDYTDNDNLSEEEVLNKVQKFLEPVPGWKPGYKIIQSKNPRKNHDGSVEYALVVCGDLEGV